MSLIFTSLRANGIDIQVHGQLQQKEVPLYDSYLLNYFITIIRLNIFLNLL